MSKKIDVIADYFVAHPNMDLSTNQIQADTGFDRADVSRCIYGLRTRERHTFPIVQVRTGVFRLEGDKLVMPLTPKPAPAPVPEPTCFEVVGRTKSGKFVIRGDNNSLFTAEPLDI